MTGTKHDADKPPMDLLPYHALLEIARGMGYGAGKYGRYNYREGLEHTRYYAAMLRHMGAWSEGEDIDQESGVHHAALAACNCLMLLTNIYDGAGTDDRWLAPTRLKGETDDRHGKTNSDVRRPAEVGGLDKHPNVPPVTDAGPQPMPSIPGAPTAAPAESVPEPGVGDPAGQPASVPPPAYGTVGARTDQGYLIADDKGHEPADAVATSSGVTVPVYGESTLTTDDLDAIKWAVEHTSDK